MGFLRARHEHLHRGFVRVYHVVTKYHLTQGIDQRLQGNAHLTDPLGQR